MIKMKKRWMALVLATALITGQGMSDLSIVSAQDTTEAVETHTMGSGIKESDSADQDSLFLFDDTTAGENDTELDPTTPGNSDTETPTDPENPTEPVTPVDPVEPVTPTKNNWNLKEKVKMVDLSYWDGDVDFAKVKKAGIKYVMLRIAHGMEKDTVFANFYKEAKENGFKIGIYYYSTATTVKKAKEEADYTLKLLSKNKVKPEDLTLPVCFDFEDPKALKTSKTNCTNMTVAFLEKIKKAGYEPMVYSSGSFYNEKLDYEQIKDYKIWVANWKVKGPIMKYPYDAWQYTATARVSGIPVKCDVSVLYPKYVAVKSLTAEKKTATVKKGKKKTLEITMKPASRTNKRLIWKSGNKRIVKIVDEQKGIIKGVRRGKTIVKVKTPNGKSYTYTVKVK